ncbi:MAG: hypothetical protein EOP04_23140 [Proteobacteria bacterium]|nr:MAG: hypothetical protein EOP04_23140 [Pseudomonadota bacterium]
MHQLVDRVFFAMLVRFGVEVVVQHEGVALMHKHQKQRDAPEAVMDEWCHAKAEPARRVLERLDKRRKFRILRKNDFFVVVLDENPIEISAY